MHIQAQVFLSVFFQVNTALVCYLRLCSQQDIVVHIELNEFFESVATTQTATILAYNTQQITKFLANHKSLSLPPVSMTMFSFGVHVCQIASQTNYIA